MKFFNQQKNKNSHTGFTIIETLVAISILLVSTTGPLSFSQNGLKASFLARDQIVAFYLAQDVIETIKNMRDNASLDGDDWLSGLGACKPEDINSTVVCNMTTAETGSFPTESCQDSLCEPLEFDADTNQFILNDGNDSKFTRTIFVTEIEDSREAQVIVEVRWESTLVAKKRIVVQENIYNWVPEYTEL